MYPFPRNLNAGPAEAIFYWCGQISVCSGKMSSTMVERQRKFLTLHALKSCSTVISVMKIVNKFLSIWTYLPADKPLVMVVLLV